MSGFKKVRQEKILPYRDDDYGRGGLGGMRPVSPPVSSIVVTCELLLCCG